MFSYLFGFACNGGIFNFPYKLLSIVIGQLQVHLLTKTSQSDMLCIDFALFFFLELSWMFSAGLVLSPLHLFPLNRLLDFDWSFHQVSYLGNVKMAPLLSG